MRLPHSSEFSLIGFIKRVSGNHAIHSIIKKYVKNIHTFISHTHASPTWKRLVHRHESQRRRGCRTGEKKSECRAVKTLFIFYSLREEHDEIVRKELSAEAQVGVVSRVCAFGRAVFPSAALEYSSDNALTVLPRVCTFIQRVNKRACLTVEPSQMYQRSVDVATIVCVRALLADGARPVSACQKKELLS